LYCHWTSLCLLELICSYALFAVICSPLLWTWSYGVHPAKMFSVYLLPLHHFTAPTNIFIISWSIICSVAKCPHFQRSPMTGSAFFWYNIQFTLALN
jgi:hypothetical protein